MSVQHMASYQTVLGPVFRPCLLDPVTIHGNIDAERR